MLHCDELEKAKRKKRYFTFHWKLLIFIHVITEKVNRKCYAAKLIIPVVITSTIIWG